MRTYFQSKEEALKNSKWHIVDAAGLPLGRLASEVASLIRGKQKPTFTTHVDGGDFVVVINAGKVKLTGRKLEQKTYSHHSGYIGGLKQIGVDRVLATFPERVIEKAVFGMLPKGKLGRKLRGKLKVYKGEEHPHAAQKPEVYNTVYTKAS